MHWGVIWDAVAAVGTVLAVIVALRFGRRDAKHRAEAQAAELAQAQQERDEAREARDRAEAADRRREIERQARAISVWRAGPRTSDYYGGPRGKGHHQDRHLGVQVMNRSDMPIFDVTVVPIEATTMIAPSRRLTVIKPDEDSSLYLDFETIDIEEVTEVRELSEVMAADELRSRALLELIDGVGAIAVEFRDAAGRRWRRHENGRLDELDDRGRPLADTPV